jgi:SAM-dependent methyltransferase
VREAELTRSFRPATNSTRPTIGSHRDSDAAKRVTSRGRGRSSGTAPLPSSYARDMADRFETAYLDGSPPWDIGRAQPELVGLLETSQITGRVIDLGCGSGENAISFGMAGLEVVGVDGSPEAIRQARDKARKRGISIRFDVADVLDLSEYRKSFDTATDSGVFHVFDDEDRPRYERSVRGVLRPGGTSLPLVLQRAPARGLGPAACDSAGVARDFHRRLAGGQNRCSSLGHPDRGCAAGGSMACSDDASLTFIPGLECHEQVHAIPNSAAVIQWARVPSVSGGKYIHSDECLDSWAVTGG